VGQISVLSVDASADALDLCRENVALNSLPGERHSLLEGDVFVLLRKFRDEARSFDLIVLDPPKLPPRLPRPKRLREVTKILTCWLSNCCVRADCWSHSRARAAWMQPCSQKIVASAALDAGADASILEHLETGADHPVALQFPEGAYLKGLVCRKN